MSGESELTRWAEAEIEKLEEQIEYEAWLAEVEAEFRDNNRLPLDQIMDEEEFERWTEATRSALDEKNKELENESRS